MTNQNLESKQGLFERMGSYLADAFGNGKNKPRLKTPSDGSSLPNLGPYRTLGDIADRNPFLDYPTQIDFSQVRIFPDNSDPSEHYPNYWEGMKEVTKAGYIPLNFPDTLRWKLWMEQQGKTKIAFEYWFDTCSGIMYKKDSDKFKIIHNPEELHRLVKKPKLVNGALEISDAIYNFYPAKEYTKSRVAYARHLDLFDIFENAIWLELCGGDKKLRKDYAKTVGSLLLNDNKFMGVWLSSNHPSKNLLRSWCVGGLDDRSGVLGDDHLDYIGRFPAVAQMESERSEE